MSSACPKLREEFRVKNLIFSGVHRGRFYNFHWRLPPVVFVLYRLALAVYVDFWFIYLGSLHAEESDTASDKLQPWPCYLTVWTYTVLALYVTIHSITVLLYYIFNPSKLCHPPTVNYHASLFHEITSFEEYQDTGYQQIMDEDYEMEILTFNNRLPWYLKIIWILLTVGSTGAVMVTVVFFVFLLPKMGGVSAVSQENLQLHILNTVIMVFENLLTAVPVRLLHVIYPCIYGLIYLLFSVFYWIPDHNHVMYQNVLDWNYPVHTIGMVILVGFVIFPLLQGMFYVIYRLKIFILKKLSTD